MSHASCSTVIVVTLPSCCFLHLHNLHCIKTSASNSSLMLSNEAKEGNVIIVLFLLISFSGGSKTRYQCACCLSMSRRNSASIDLTAWINDFIISGRLSWQDSLLWWKEYRVLINLPISKQLQRKGLMKQQMRFHSLWCASLLLVNFCESLAEKWRQRVNFSSVTAELSTPL